MGRPYTLRVAEEDEQLTRDIATYVDGKMVAFRKAFPKQAEATSAVIVALAIAEELFTLKEKNDAVLDGTNKALDDLSDVLDAALQSTENGVDEKSTPASKG